MAKLVAVGGGLDGKEFSLGGEKVIGRADDCEIIIASPRVSRRHARLFKDAAGFTVEDLGSKNGTFVNDLAARRQVLHEGDEISVGDQKFVFREDVGVRPRPRIASPFAAGRALKHKSVADSGVAVVPGMPEELSSHNINVSMRIDLEEFRKAEAAEKEKNVGAMKRSHERLSTMIGVSNALSTIHELNALLDEILDLLFKIFPQGRGFVMLTDEETGELQQQTVRRSAALADSDEKITVSTAVINEVMSGPNAVLSSDTMSDDRFSDRMSIVNLQIRSMMCAPLVVRDEVLGLIHLDTTSRSGAFTEDDLQLLTGVANQAAISIKNARLMDQVQAEAATRGQLQRYLSPDLVDRIQRGEMDLDVGGDMKHGTVFFSDIIGFTRMSEQMPPSDVVALLNRYFHVMEEIIFRHGGTIDKFGGDSIMAFWGVLVSREFDAIDAVSAAVEMQNGLFAFNCELKDQERTAIRMGIGLNTGEFVAGNIGSEQKIEFTVIGDAVNLAQRIESLAGRGQVLISPSTYEAVRTEVCAIEFPPVMVKNKTEPVSVFNVRALRPTAGSGRRGMVLTLPVELTAEAPDGGTELVTPGQIVWGRVRTENVVELEVVTERRLKPEAPCSMKLLIQGMSDSQPVEASVLYSADGSGETRESFGGGAVLVAENAPDDFMRFLEPGSHISASADLEELGRV